MAPCESQSSRTNPLRGSCVSERSRCGAVRIFYVAREPSAEIVRVESLSLWRRAHLKARGRTLCGDRACRSALAVAPCEFSTWPTNPLQRLRVSNRTRCGAVRIFYVADEPSAEIVRVESLSLWRRAHLKARGRTLCGDRACQSALAVAPCEFSTWPANPPRRLCVSNRSRCGAVRISKLADEPSAGIVRVGALSLWRRANFLRGRRTLCRDCACRIALAVAPCEFSTWPTNPLRGSCVSERSRCGAVRIFYVADEPSAEIARVESHSLWRRANFLRGRRTLCGDCACRIALAVAPCDFFTWPTNPLRRFVRVGSLSLWFSQNLSTKVVREARSRSSGLRIASFK